MIGIVGHNPCERKNNVSDSIEDTNNTHESIDGIIDIDNNEIILEGNIIQNMNYF